MIDKIRYIMSQIKDNDILVSSTGLASRAVFNVKDRDLNFYVQGSMGASLGIGIGLALNTNRQVNVVAGDGDILMSLGTLVLMNKLNLPNLKLWILDNNSYCATGNQKTCSDAVDFESICKEKVVVFKIFPIKPKIGRITLTPKEVRKRFENAIRM